MALQKVNHISYLGSVPLDLAKVADINNVDICILPEGAEVLEVSIEVTKAGPATAKGSLKIDSKEFITDADLNQTTCYKSSIITTLKKSSILKGEFNQNDGELIVRVHYFLPSQILAEYAN